MKLTVTKTRGVEFLIKQGFMTVNQFSKTSPLLQADSITISVFSPSTSHFITILTLRLPISKWQRSLFYAESRDNLLNDQNKGFGSIPKMIQVTIHPNSELRSSLGLEIA